LSPTDGKALKRLAMFLQNFRGVLLGKEDGDRLLATATGKKIGYMGNNLIQDATLKCKNLVQGKTYGKK